MGGVKLALQQLGWGKGGERRVEMDERWAPHGCAHVLPIFTQKKNLVCLKRNYSAR